MKTIKNKEKETEIKKYNNIALKFPQLSRVQLLFLEPEIKHKRKVKIGVTCKTGKQTYLTKADAIRVLEYTKSRYSGRIVYKCSACGKYHIGRNKYYSGMSIFKKDKEILKLFEVPICGYGLNLKNFVEGFTI